MHIALALCDGLPFAADARALGRVAFLHEQANPYTSPAVALAADAAEGVQPKAGVGG